MNAEQGILNDEVMQHPYFIIQNSLFNIHYLIKSPALLERGFYILGK
jgi:hypothetical protein